MWTDVDCTGGTVVERTDLYFLNVIKDTLVGMGVDSLSRGSHTTLFPV